MFGLSLGKGIVYAVAAVAVVGMLTGAYFAILNKGKAIVQARFDAYIEAQAQATRETERVVEKVVVKVEERVVEKIKTVRVKGETIVKEVPVYVTKTDDAACELRSGFVRVHDAAASNTPSGPAAESDRDPSGIALSEALAVVADNYSRYHACREQVIGWNQFWSEYVSAVKTSGCVPQE